ncbi:YjgN family protein [Dinoroseobacter sp. PD6]|uniref:YjgN family protein n=1 Tax=Dinoroseobacter sp. PD6 TaxID=3028384 RepID=UPI00237BA778|nr:YjgN family protein [Dinoroseobacter sp. PD6]MDD9718077.1 YjgN family protein [Dinoroseobacter sp. PD6]
MSEQVEFKGDTGEWFGIWIVNIVLTILTIGIYSAWAKVRTKQYFYRNTIIGGRSFDYHATGLQILIGRIIVIVGLIAYSLLAAIPVLAILLPLGFLALFPFLMYRSLRFNARVSSWSGVRFNFAGTYGGAFKAYLLAPFLTALTAYLAWPFAERAQRRYVVNGHRLGRTPFTFDAPIGPFYRAFFAAIGWFFAVLICGALLSSMIPDALPTPQNMTAQDMRILALVLSILPFAVFGFFTALVLFRAMVRNIVYNAALLDGKHRFVSTVSPLQVLWIAVTNGVAVILTLGLALPWAQIRLARYFAAETRFIPDGSLDNFIAHFEQEKGAFGDAFTDIEGLDFGINL